MNWLLVIVGFISGIFAISQILITICTALPLTISLDKKGLVRTKAIYLANIRTIVLNLAIPAVLYVFFNEKSWWSPLSVSFLSGCGVMMLCIAKCFPNDNNKTDYFKAYANFLHTDKILAENPLD